MMRVSKYNGMSAEQFGAGKPLRRIDNVGNVPTQQLNSPSVLSPTGQLTTSQMFI